MSKTDFMQLLTPITTYDHMQGDLDAPVSIVQYCDYSCFQCGKLQQILKVLQKQFDYPFRIVYRHFPQSQRYPQSQKAAEAAEAAAAQGQFWSMHDLLFNHQYALDDSYLVEYANYLGLNIPQFLRDMSEHIYSERVQKDFESGKSNGIQKAPALFINGVLYTDSWNIDHLLEAMLQV